MERMKRIRRLAKQNAYAASISQHLQRLSSSRSASLAVSASVSASASASISALTGLNLEKQGVISSIRQQEEEPTPSISDSSSLTDPLGDDANNASCEENDIQADNTMQSSSDDYTSALVIATGDPFHRPESDQQLEEQLSQESVPQLCQVWVNSANALLHTREMSLFLSSSRDVALGLTGNLLHGVELMIKISFLPVTLPIHLVGSVAQMLLFNLSSQVLTTTPPAIANTANNALLSNCRDDDGSDLSSQDSSSPIDCLVHHVSNAVVPTVRHVVEGIQNAVGGPLLSLFLTFSQGNSECRQQSDIVTDRNAGESTSEKLQFLQRLRIDVDEESASHTTNVPPHESSQNDRITTSSGLPSTSSLSHDFSKSLLRVNDLNIRTHAGDALCFVDLCPDFCDEQLTSRAFEALLEKGTSLVSMAVTFPASPSDFTQNDSIQWKPEDGTRKFLKLNQAISTKDDAWYHLLAHNTLVWSGKFRLGAYHDLESPLFWSRGVVPGSPRAVYEMLCDSSRTTEYNRFCLGRSDDIIIENEETVCPEEKRRIIKVVKSETRVPFTSLSVTLSTLMYGIELDDHDHDVVSGGETYIIVSRSLTSGRAGCHLNGHDIEERELAKNGITWGVNLMRPVPNNPNVTDLVNLSQVNSSLVPRFLTHKVGMMAVENSFQAIRSR